MHMYICLIISAERLGFDDYIPPFATANGPEIIKGVNYASGSAGIRDETGSHQVLYEYTHNINMLL